MIFVSLNCLVVFMSLTCLDENFWLFVVHASGRIIRGFGLSVVVWGLGWEDYGLGIGELELYS